MDFILHEKTGAPGWWLLQIPEYSIVIEFEEHKFNETQQIKFIDPGIFETIPGQERADLLASIMQQAGDWLFSHAYSIAMPVPVFEFREYDDGQTYLLRHSSPRLRIEVIDSCTASQLSNALRAASEFVRKRAGR